MTKVLHVLEHSLPRMAGYTIRSKYIVKHQQSEGITPVVISSPLQGKTHRPLADFEVIDGVRYYRTGRYNHLEKEAHLPMRLLARYAYSRAYQRAIMAVAQKEEAAIIHAHSSYLNGVRANDAARRLGLPSVYEVRGLWQDTAMVNAGIGRHHWKYRFVSYMDRKAMVGADRVVAISNLLKQEIAALGVDARKIFVVPNGVDTRVFQPKPKRSDLVERYGLSGHVVFGFIGSIRRIEGLALFIREMPNLLKEDEKTRVLLVGDGDEVERLKEIAENSGVPDRIVFTGRVPHDQILDYYALIDIFIYPRIDAKVNQKVTPLKPLEAMAMEKAVIASDVGGLKELVIENVNGLLFEADNGAHLRQRCRQLLQDPDLRIRLGHQARKWVVGERDWRRVIQCYREVYDGLGRR